MDGTLQLQIMDSVCCFGICLLFSCTSSFVFAAIAIPGFVCSSKNINCMAASQVNIPIETSDSGTKFGSIIIVKDLCYVVKEKKSEKIILNNITGIFKRGLNAILGPTGGGKTTLLDCIAGRKDPSGTRGTILIDGASQPHNYKLMSGYVVQDDIIMGTLSVEENLMFSANMRLPSTTSANTKRAKVDAIMQELGITHVAKSKVGNEFFRGISGGERKRTSIGMELVFSPSVLFLDEPTTGLDAFTASSVIRLLSRLGTRGRTIIFSIHQPRYTIFKMFERITLLARGKLVYQGPGMEALEYFKTIGYECEQHDNPADFFLDAIIRHNPTPGEVGLKESKVNVIDPYASAADLNAKFQQSKWFTQLEAEVDPVVTNAAQCKTDVLKCPTSPVADYVSGFGTQFKYLSGRSIKNAIRTPQTSIGQLFTLTFFALIIGLLYYNVTNNLPAAVQNRIGAFFFISMNMVMSNMSALELFNKERHLFTHESSSGFYRVSAFFLAKIVCDIVPLRIFPILIYGTISYFLVGFETDAVKFFLYILMLIELNLSGVAIVFATSTSTKTFAVAQLLTVMVLIIMMVFGGFFVQVDSIVIWLRWLKYVSIFRYGLNAIAISQLKHKTLYALTPNGTVANPDAGNQALENLSIPNKTDLDFWINYIALPIIMTFFLILAYINLRRINKYK